MVPGRIGSSSRWLLRSVKCCWLIGLILPPARRRLLRGLPRRRGVSGCGFGLRRTGWSARTGGCVNSHDLLVFESQAAKFRAQLGLDPMSDAALAKSRAAAVLAVADLESIRARCA